MRPGRHQGAAEQQHAKERRLEKESRQHFIADQRSKDITGHFREARPVGAELVGKRDSGNDSHGEGHGKDLGPEPREAMEVLVPCAFPQDEQRRDIGGQADRERREDNVEADGERELESGEQQCVHVH